MNRIDSDFMSSGTRCAGWLLIPDGTEKPPVIIMAHGFGADRKLGLEIFAERFTQNGFAVYLFDYRTFGDSDGNPRNLVSPKMHLEDWKEAISHVKSLNNIDTNKIAIWGTSFSGGHAIVSAAKIKGISAVIAQVPFVDGLASSANYPVSFILKAAIYGIRDILRHFTFRKPLYIPIVGEPDEFAVLNTPECMPGIMKMLPSGYEFQNYCAARILLTLPMYRPISYAAKVDCPVLLVVAKKDTLIPLNTVEKTGNKIKKCRIKSFPVGHFDVYTDNIFEEVIETEINFLKEVI